MQVTQVGGVPSDTSHVCDQVIVTVPLGVLKHGTPTFEPALSAAKQSAIARLGVGTTDKMVMLFDHVFWPADVTYFGVGVPGEYRGFFFKFVNVHAVVDRPVLMAVVVGMGPAAFERSRRGLGPEPTSS